MTDLPTTSPTTHAANPAPAPVAAAPVANQKPRHPVAWQDVDPLWYKNAVIYQLHVRSFSDSTGDGVGDFIGLISKLDYLADLGVTAIWLQPFYPSPLKDDGYDIADFTGVNPCYGNMEDVRCFIQEAHARGMRVITELVINHTSDQHPFFQRARRAPKGSPEREFYVWSDTPEKYQGVRIIFKDFETSNWAWDTLAGQYYWHRFYAHQPDLNFDNPAVQQAVLETCSFWMKLGVDGMRLDAIPYLFEREGTSCENLPETHEFLRTLRAHVEKNFPGRMLLAEANQWPEDAIAYFGSGDECHMAFHFPLMPRLFMALRMEEAFPIIDILEQTPAIPSNCQWAVFLRNHDELTLEMVTDEERDYMYRVYAGDPEARINLGIRRRLAPLLSNNRRTMELMSSLLFSLPGTPIIYYGDEIGMGDNVYLGDRNGVRTPMQWSADRNAGFSRGNPQRLFLPIIIDPEYHYETVNVESQAANPSSMLWWTKRLIALRMRYPVFGRGEMRFLQTDSPHTLAFIRRDADHTVMVVANLSRFVRPVSVQLDDEFRGHTPVEMFGKVRFPTIEGPKLFLSLGPHGFYWFLLEKPSGSDAKAEAVLPVPVLRVPGPPDRVLTSGALPRELERALPQVLPSQRWFVSKARVLRSVRVLDRVLVGTPGRPRGCVIVMARCEFASGEPDTYAIPLMARPVSDDSSPQPVGPPPIAHIADGREPSADLVDAMSDPEFARTLLRLALTGERTPGTDSRLEGSRIGPLPREPEHIEALQPHTPKLEQSNSNVVFGDRYLLKLFRRLERGRNPELEVGAHLARVGFPHVAPIAGAVEIVEETQRHTLSVAFKFVQSQGDAWSWMLERSHKFLERAAATPAADAARVFIPAAGDHLEPVAVPPPLAEIIGEPLESARLLGVRSAELHAALADDRGDPDFTPEPFTPTYQRGLFQSVRNAIRAMTGALAHGIPSAPEHTRRLVAEVAAAEPKLLAAIRSITARPLTGSRIRIHGDYHLGQVLWTGRDFIIIDFEGEPLRSIGERRLKRSPLRDVAGMIRSFDYVAQAGLRKHRELTAADAKATSAPESLSAAADLWSGWMSRVFVTAYVRRIGDLNPSLLGSDPISQSTLLRMWLIEKAVHEIVYELNSRPDWVEIPLRAVAALAASGGETTAVAPRAAGGQAGDTVTKSGESSTLQSSVAPPSPPSAPSPAAAKDDKP